MEIDEQDKKIYNLYLKAQAEHNNRPYSPRKNFSNMNKEDVGKIKRLVLFFNQYKDINPLLYFRSGFKKEEAVYPTLSFFLSLKASRLYSKYIKEMYEEDVDNVESLRDYKEGIIFIHDFITANDLTIDEYKAAVNEAGVKWVEIHFKKQNISFYHLHTLGVDIEDFPKDYRELIADHFEDSWYKTRRAYETSKTMKQIGDRFVTLSNRAQKRAR